VYHTAFKTFKQILQESYQLSIGLVPIRFRPLTEEVAYSQGDYDYLLNPRQKHEFLQLVFHHCHSTAIPFFIDQRKRNKTIVQLRDPDTKRGITLELWASLEVKDPARHGVSRIWWDDVTPHIQISTQANTFAAEFESLYYLSHIQTKHKQFEHPEVQARLKHYAHRMQHNTEVSAIYQGLLTDMDIQHAAAQANRQLIEMGVLTQRRKLSSLLRNTRETLYNRVYKAHARWQARGNIIAFVGPDGVGKTTIINVFKHQLSGKVHYFRFKKLFRGALLYQLLLPLLRLMANRHHREKLAKNQIDDHFGGLLFLIARLRYPTISVRRLWHSILLTDRFFHDFFTHGLRFTGSAAATRKGSNLLLHLLPQPRCLVQLDAEYAIIASRKNELSEEDVTFYRNSVFDTYLRNPSPYYLYLNTVHPIEVCAAVLATTAPNIALHLNEIATKPIDLTEATVLGRGNERTCYADPEHIDRCIKTKNMGKGERDQNRLEQYYLTSLLRRQVPFDYIPRYYGQTETTNGSGLIFERIVDKEGNPGPSLGNALLHGTIDCDKVQQLLHELYDYLRRYAVVFADISLNNILVGTTPTGEEGLYIIDGLGARRYGLKLWLQTNLKWVARNKLDKQWPILLQRLKVHCPNISKNR
jgi:thymidylate kinase